MRVDGPATTGADPFQLPVATGTELVPVGKARVPVATAPPATPESAEASRMLKITGGVDIRAASPREMSALSLDLYAAGIISYDDYTVLAFQPELHPDYDRTIGALTGEAARPDGPRNYVHAWDERLRFDLRHQPGNSATVKQTKRILGVLKQIAQPTEMKI